MRGMYEGGEQERKLVGKFRKDADRLQNAMAIHSQTLAPIGRRL